MGLFITLNTETHCTHYRPFLNTTFFCSHRQKLASPISNGNRYRYTMMSSSVSIAWVLLPVLSWKRMMSSSARRGFSTAATVREARAAVAVLRVGVAWVS